MKTITMIFVFVLLIVLLILPILSYAVDDGLVAYWTFNDKDGDTASDATGNGHDGTLIGDPQWVDGYFEGALEFDQNGEEVEVPFHADLNQETFTISAWVSITPSSTGHRAVVSCRDVAPRRGYIFYVTPNNDWQFWTGGNNKWNIVSGPAVNVGEWEHIAGVYTDGKQKFYVNGELVGEIDSALSLNTAQNLLIGAGANEKDTHDFFFKGLIDEVRIYDRELSADEIVSVMESEAAIFADVNGDGKVNILDLVFVAGKFGQPVTADNQAADVNGDDAINIRDLVIVAQHFGN